MKKFIIITLAILSLMTPLFAESELDSPAYNQIKVPYVPLNPKAMAMGGASLLWDYPGDALYRNPAILANREVWVSLPSVTFALYHPSELLASGTINKLTSGGMEGVVDAISPFLSAGQGKIADIGVGIGFSVGGFAFSIDPGVSILTYAPENSTGGVKSNVIAEAIVPIMFGYGMSFDLPLDMKLSAGASIGFQYVAFNEAIGLNSVMDAMSENSTGFDGLLNGINMFAGFSIPINIGVNLDLPLGFQVGTTLQNIIAVDFLGEASVNDYLHNYFPSSNRQNMYSGFRWNLGAKWSWDRFGALFTPTIEIDFNDITDGWDGSDFGRSLVNHFNLGIDIKTCYVLDLMLGLNGGYFSFGLGLNFYALKIEAAYFTKEFSNVAGMNGIDAFTVKLSIGWDKP